MMNRKMVDVQGKQVEEVVGECSICGKDTYAGAESMYEEDLYMRGFCYCGWRGESAMESPGLNEPSKEEIISSLQEEMPITQVEKFTEHFSMLYARMYSMSYDSDLFEVIKDFPLEEKLLKEAFHKTCYYFKVRDKKFDADTAYESERVKVTNYNLLALVPEEKNSIGVCTINLTEVEEF